MTNKKTNKVENELDNIKLKTNDGKTLSMAEEAKNLAIKLNNSISSAQRIAKKTSSKGNYQPTTSEGYLNDVNFNPSSITNEELEMLLLNPRSSDKKLRRLSQYLKNSVGQYQKLMYYYTSLLSFDTMLIPKNLNNKDMLKGEKYKEEYYKACDVVGKINPKKNFISMANQTIQNGFSVWWVIEDENGNPDGFLQLPTDWCYITSKTQYGWTAALDLTFFDRIAWTPSLIPEIYEAYEKFNEMRRDLIKGDSDSSIQYYPLPIERTWVFTFDPDDASKIPPLSNTFQSSIDWLAYRKLLKDISILDNWKTIAAKIPQKKNSDELIMSYGEAFEIVDVIQSVLPENMTIFASPFDVEPISLNQVNTLNDLVSMSNNNFYSSAGTTGQFFGEMDSTKSAKAIQVNQAIDYLFVAKQIYPQFMKWTDLCISLRLSEYTFEVRYDGNELERSSEIETASKLVSSSNFPVSYLAAKVGFLPNEVFSLANIENELGVKDDILKPMTSQHTQSSKETGRPKMDISKTENDGTIASKDSRGGD